MTSSSVVCRSREAARARHLPMPAATEDRSGSANRPKTDKG